MSIWKFRLVIWFEFLWGQVLYKCLITIAMIRKNPNGKRKNIKWDKESRFPPSASLKENKRESLHEMNYCIWIFKMLEVSPTLLRMQEEAASIWSHSRVKRTTAREYTFLFSLGFVSWERKVFWNDWQLWQKLESLYSKYLVWSIQWKVWILK